MSKRSTPVDAAKEAAQHHTTLCKLDTIANLAQDSDIHRSAYRLGERIAALCRAEQQRQLQKYDAAFARIDGVAARQDDPDQQAIIAELRRVAQVTGQPLRKLIANFNALHEALTPR